MKAILLTLLATTIGALTSCTVSVNDDGSKSVMIDPVQVANALGAGPVRYEDGKIVATK